MYRSICAKKRAQTLDPFMGSKYFFRMFHRFTFFCPFSLLFLFAELDAVLICLGQGVSPVCPRVTESSDNSGDESGTSQPRRRVRYKRT